MVAAATLASVLTACGGSGDSGLGVIEIRSLSTVSYTHLTLPTKRIV